MQVFFLLLALLQLRVGRLQLRLQMLQLRLLLLLLRAQLQLLGVLQRRELLFELLRAGPQVAALLSEPKNCSLQLDHDLLLLRLLDQRLLQLLLLLLTALLQLDLLVLLQEQVLRLDLRTHLQLNERPPR